MVIITARKRSLRRLCFHRCLSVHRWGSAPLHTPPRPTSPCAVHAGIWSTSGRYASHSNAFLLPPATKLGQGNIFRSVSTILSRGGMHGFIRGGVHGFIQWGACVVLFSRGACMVLFSGGACVVLFSGGHAWFYSVGGVRGFIQGGVRGFFSFSGYNEIRSMSGRYASYWNAFLFINYANTSPSEC